MRLSVILPARNEEGHIQRTVRDIFSYLTKKKYLFEIIVVVNGSTDKTQALVEALSQKHPQVKLVVSKPGYGLALKKGLTESRGDYVIIYNVDFYDLKLIDLVDIELYGKDLIIGSKRAHWSSDIRPIHRRLVSIFFNLYLKIMYGFKGSDTHGIKVLKREVINRVLKKCQTNSGIFDTELVLRTQRANFKIADFPVDVREVRPSRFRNRLFQTPIDIYHLYLSLKS